MHFSKRLFVVAEVLILLSNCACNQYERVQAAQKEASAIFLTYKTLFAGCLQTSMSNPRFLVDNLHSYVNAFSRTTVGFAPQFTSNRKFFANMLNTATFKNVLHKDVAALHKNYIEKMKFCDTAVMNQESLRQFYDREVDQTKI